jgi:hypothetical protein
MIKGLKPLVGTLMIKGLELLVGTLMIKGLELLVGTLMIKGLKPLVCYQGLGQRWVVDQAGMRAGWDLLWLH